jgi:A/G-specific adenine glycosylase
VKTGLAKQLLAWYKSNGREMPWRGLKDPYLIWVSEIMLQQTQVETVKPYFEKWQKRYPDLRTLAGSEEQDVLKTWEGLGYYSRARNMLRAARLIMEIHNGQLPEDSSSLQKLPGIGKYTAAAIASIAFGEDIPALDGNIRRVAARLDDLTLPVKSKDGESRIFELLRANLPTGKTADFNQALMDLGSLICLPGEPQCDQCPIKEFCKSYLRGTQKQRPIKETKPDIPHYIVTAAVIRDGDKVLITRRPAKGLLGGMWEFPGGKVEPGESLEQALAREIKEELGVKIKVGSEIGQFKHAYTHFRITLHAFHCTHMADRFQALQVDEFKWCSRGDLKNYPMGKVDRLISRVIENM